jgi:hypothetical protein
MELKAKITTRPELNRNSTAQEAANDAAASKIAAMSGFSSKKRVVKSQPKLNRRKR